MKPVRLMALVVASFLAMEIQAMSASYYVSTTGSDSGPGSASLPFLTPQKAADVVLPGDVVSFYDGIYTGNRNSSVVDVARGGSSGNFVVFQSINPGGAKINGQNNARDFGFRLRASFVEVRGFDIYGMLGAGVYINEPGTSDFRVIRNELHDIGRTCFTGDTGLVGIFVRQPRTYIDGDIFHDIGRFANGEMGCVQTIPRNHDHGIYSAADGSGINQANELTIVNCGFYNLFQGWAMQIDKGSYHDVIIAYNTCNTYNPDRDGQILFIDIGTITNLQLKNNLLYNAHTAGIYFFDGTYVNATVANNLINSGTLMKKESGIAGGVSATGTVTADPVFVSAGSNNYRIQKTSPAIGAATTISGLTVTTDADGKSRPTADIGAYGYRSAVPSPPTNVRIIS